MKTSVSLLSSALLLVMTSSAFAASSVDLTVKGLITPSACTPSLPGDIDFGKIAAQDLDLDKSTYLERKTVQLSVNCDAATLFAIEPIDNRAGSAMYGAAFGLGMINQNQKLGMYQLAFSNPVAETPSTLLAMYNADGRWVTLLPDDGIAPNELVALGSRGESGWAPHPIKDAMLDVTLYTAIAPAKNLTLTDEVAIDGSATFEVKYL
ncbi:DUF1120 domain-containing protein [Pseudomonas fluorescens]|uniref:DUF1120 domain-containing protein n=1 Tax=Pseudomonas fluorescens TaxID=294 RepID=A0AAE2Q120_PSEFL|nr:MULTISPECIES: DUF1120 domain-containing protein [Pseudomonas fluorescens group]MBA1428404.1 DUF1120 domain-containing protein [Pseudomonas orientalis]MBD8147125.1 DUF1120 domain-containing protein [Pseudomonas fluorescens]MBD8175597.1 DUF1120 domain-containing protein [Pseudomonas fluorescens]MBD8271918.1 DUF1120 domain-containing protein [Pseudomonas fluorescens]MBD8744052.1 DUF1120 domain-containing protein [Pseudomonas fluorescens]